MSLCLPPCCRPATLVRSVLRYWVGVPSAPFTHFLIPNRAHPAWFYLKMLVLTCHAAAEVRPDDRPRRGRGATGASTILSLMADRLRPQRVRLRQVQQECHGHGRQQHPAAAPWRSPTVSCRRRSSYVPRRTARGAGRVSRIPRCHRLQLYSVFEARTARAPTPL